MDKGNHWSRLTRHERILRARGLRLIAGVDEAGRGPLAGPVVTAAVVLDCDTKIVGVNDSKQLSAAKRETLYDEIMDKAIAVKVVAISPAVIDDINIYYATLKGMKDSVLGLGLCPEFVLVDGNRSIPELPYEQRPIVGGDRRCACIAAASIIAKVTRDRMMCLYDEEFPGYGFSQHKGYPTKAHIQSLLELGPCPIHRRSFGIVKELAEKDVVG